MNLPLQRISDLSLSNYILDTDLLILNRGTTETKAVTIGLIKSTLPEPGSTLYINQSPPVSPVLNNVWVKPTDKELYYYNGSNWFLLFKDISESSLLDHKDTEATNLSNNSVLVYNSTNQKWQPSTSGVLFKSDYDSNNNGVVDNSERLSGNLPSYYLNRINHIGSLDVTNLTTSVGFAGNLLRWDGSNWGAAAIKLIDLFDVSVGVLPTEDDYYLSWDTTLDRFILKTINLTSSNSKHVIRYLNTDFTPRTKLEFIGDLVSVADQPLNDKTVVSITLPTDILRESDVGYQLDGSVALSRSALSVPWSGVSSKPSIPININDLNDVNITFTPTVSDSGKALIWTGSSFNVGVPIDQKPAPDILYELASTTSRTRVNFTGSGVEVLDNPSNNAIDIRITGLTSDSMAKSIYDPNEDGIVLSADSINGIATAANSTYYGKNSAGSIGFHTFSSDFLTKSIYASATNLDSVYNSDRFSYQLPSYYLNRSNHTGSQNISTLSQSSASTNQSIRWSGSAWVAYTPSDMYKSTYDTNNNGAVDLAESIQGISSADNYTYYGKNAAGVVGFHPVPQTDGLGDMQKAFYDLDDDGVVNDSERLNGQTSIYYLNRSNHTGTTTSSTISDFSDTTKSLINSTIISSSSVLKTYNSGVGTLSLDIVDNTTNQRLQLANQGSLIGTRRRLNFINGNNITIDAVDNPGSDRVDVTINSTASGGGGGGITLIDANNYTKSQFNTYTKAQVVQAIQLTEASTILTDASLSNNFKVTLTGNRILSNPTNLIEGGTYNWLITIDATGNRTLTLGNSFILSAGSTFATNSNARNVLSCIFINGFLYCSVAKF